MVREVLVDANVLIDLLTGDPAHMEWSLGEVTHC